MRALLIALLVACGGSESPEPSGPSEPPASSSTTGAETVAEPEASVTPSAQCTGEVTQSPSRQAVYQVHERLRQCYVAPVNADVPVVRFDVTIRVERDGTNRATTTIRTEDDRPFPGVERLRACVENVLSEPSFGGVRGGDCAVVRLPLVFDPAARSNSPADADG